jgi:hypothetical protein
MGDVFGVEILQGEILVGDEGDAFSYRHADDVRDWNFDGSIDVRVMAKKIIFGIILQDEIRVNCGLTLFLVNAWIVGDGNGRLGADILIKSTVALAFCSRRNVLVEYNRVATWVEIKHVSEALRKFHIHKGTLELVAETDSQKCRLNLLDFAESQYVVEYWIIRVFIAEVNIVAFLFCLQFLLVTKPDCVEVPANSSDRNGTKTLKIEGFINDIQNLIHGITASFA